MNFPKPNSSPFKVDTYGETKTLSDSEMSACLKESPPQESGSFEQRLISSLSCSISLSPLDIEIKGHADF